MTFLSTVQNLKTSVYLIFSLFLATTLTLTNLGYALFFRHKAYQTRTATFEDMGVMSVRLANVCVLQEYNVWESAFVATFTLVQTPLSL